MVLVYFRDLLEDDAEPQYGVLNEEDDYSYVICLKWGSVFEYGDYEIIKRLSWSDIEIVEKAKQAENSGIFVVCMNDEYVRDAEMLDTSELSDKEFNNIDFMSSDLDVYWKDMFPIPFIAIVEAVSKEAACKKAAEQKHYDSRCLYAIKI